MPLDSAARDERAPWLRLVLTPGVGAGTALSLLRAYGLPEAIFAAGTGALVRVAGTEVAARLKGSDPARDTAVAAALDWAQGPDRHLISLADPRYPARLLEIGDPPPLLYVLGDPAALALPALAVVGSRSCTAAGQGNARAFARSLADAGLAIVSGLALGIDAAAHRGALDAADGRTIAILGTGLDTVYPAEHRDLARQVAGRGALVSELPLGTAPQRWNFPRRNRLIAGLSMGVLVVEAAKRSGSLITARLAGEFGREVFAIPGSIHSPVARGCHALIRQGAKLVESADDVLSELRMPRTRPASAAAEQLDPAGTASQGASAGAAALLASLGWDPAGLDELAQRTGQGAGALNETLLELELSGVVERLADGRYQRRG